MTDTSIHPFETTLSAYKQGFHVSHIATFSLQTCALDETVDQVYERHPDFDQVPVAQEGCIVGVLERADHQSAGRVSEQARPLDDSILVEAGEPLIDFIPLMAAPPYYRLVLQGARITGIVTRSDLLKLPVRLLGFALVTNLELVMKEVIEKHLPEESEWLRLLSDKRKAKVLEKQERYAPKRMEPPLAGADRLLR